jgi:hypothetical protein
MDSGRRPRGSRRATPASGPSDAGTASLPILLGTAQRLGSGHADPSTRPGREESSIERTLANPRPCRRRKVAVLAETRALDPSNRGAVAQSSWCSFGLRTRELPIGCPAQARRATPSPARRPPCPVRDPGLGQGQRSRPCEPQDLSKNVIALQRGRGGAPMGFARRGGGGLRPRRLSSDGRVGAEKFASPLSPSARLVRWTFERRDPATGREGGESPWRGPSG